jgi:hypothetical protein
MPKTPIILEPRQSNNDSADVKLDAPAQNTSARRKPSPWNWKKSHKRKDSFALMMDDGTEDTRSSGTKKSGRNDPPSIDELKRIAEDIKNGLY